MPRLVIMPALLAIAIVFQTLILTSPSHGKGFVETGPANFLRNHDQAMAAAKKQEKPVFALFQEVPG